MKSDPIDFEAMYRVIHMKARYPNFEFYPPLIQKCLELNEELQNIGKK